jgi:hypothetical protein
MEYGNSRRVKLTCDLTKYDSRLTVGQEGKTIPHTKLSIWGSQDRFVAVDFDCGAKLDILLSGLDILENNK